MYVVPVSNPWHLRTHYNNNDEGEGDDGGDDGGEGIEGGRVGGVCMCGGMYLVTRELPVRLANSMALRVNGR